MVIVTTKPITMRINKQKIAIDRDQCLIVDRKTAKALQEKGSMRVIPENDESYWLAAWRAVAWIASNVCEDQQRILNEIDRCEQRYHENDKRGFNAIAVLMLTGKEAL